MQLTKFTDNALRVLIHLASHPERAFTITELAEACDVPRNHLTKVVHVMGQKNLLKTTRGKGGGVSLAKSADQLRVGQVVRAMEGEEELVNCLRPECPLGPKCELRFILRAGQGAMLAKLDEKTIADLI